MPGQAFGHLTEELQKEIGFDVEVVAPATHDTGSAVLAVPANDDDLSISAPDMVSDGNRKKDSGLLTEEL